MNFTVLARLSVPVGFVLLAACGGGSGGGGGGDTTAPTATVTTNAPTMPDPALVPENTVVTITFSESMDTTAGAWSIGGDLAAESNAGAWSTTTAANDTLTISPAAVAGWVAKPARQLTVDARDVAGNPLATLVLTYDVYRGIVYFVDINMPNDLLDGLTPATARKFIHSAVANAIPPATVLVTAGDYRLSSQLGTHVVLRDEVSLYGGYNATFTMRDPATNVSRIEDRSTAGAGYAMRDAFPAPITEATFVDGFTIQGSTQGATFSSAIFLASSSTTAPTIQHNVINGGSGATASRGIEGGGAMVRNNVINGGSGGTSYAVYGCRGVVEDNTIHGGSGSASYGVSACILGTVQNNTIHGGSGSISIGVEASTGFVQDNTIVGGSGPGESRGMWINGNVVVRNNSTVGDYGVNIRGGSPVLQGNVISGGISHFTGAGGSGATGTIVNNLVYGGIVEFDSSSTIRNNIIHGGIHSIGADPIVENNMLLATPGSNTRCLEESPLILGGPANGDPRRVNNNNFFGCAVVYYDYDAGCAANGDGDGDPRTCTLAEMAALTDIFGGVSGNISANPVFADVDGPDNVLSTMDDNDWHFSSGSPISVRAGGLNGQDQIPLWSFNTDKDGVIRPASGNPWSIGAYQ